MGMLGNDHCGFLFVCLIILLFFFGFFFGRGVQMRIYQKCDLIKIYYLCSCMFIVNLEIIYLILLVLLMEIVCFFNDNQKLVFLFSDFNMTRICAKTCNLILNERRNVLYCK